MIGESLNDSPCAISFESVSWRGDCILFYNVSIIESKSIEAYNLSSNLLMIKASLLVGAMPCICFAISKIDFKYNMIHAEDNLA